MPAAEDRYLQIVKAGIPLIIAPGCADLILYNGVEKIPVEKRNRKFVEHNALHTHVKTDYREMYRLGEYFNDRLAPDKEHVTILIPLRGFSQKNHPNGPLYDPEADRGFLDALQAPESPKLHVQTIDAHINDDAFAEACCSELLRRSGGNGCR
jgi:uncharacterized protein (UPF0261 family)